MTRSYSDTDELEGSLSDTDSDNTESGVPTVAVVERGILPDDQSKRTDLGHLRLGATFMSRATANRVIGAEDADADLAENFVVSTGRKGRVVRDRRPAGKKGVRRSKHANTNSKFVQDLATADTMIAVATPMDFCHHLNYNSKPERHSCCKLCNPPKSNMHVRDHGGIAKRLLDQL